ncbi:MAG TPA: MarR family transcriptional regulator [Candidatus Paceibacterota bacterium]|nr:MarR family transcriptional regulator [Candidatus Paceibacterota bacterium]
MSDKNFQELASLFFEMRQTIRANLPRGKADPNDWMRCETLRFIDQKRPTMQEVARQLRITAPSATSLARKLKKLGWITRTSAEKDKRVVRIALTAKGERELDRYRRQSEKTMRKVFSRLQERDLSHLKRALRNLKDIHAA